MQLNISAEEIGQNRFVLRKLLASGTCEGSEFQVCIAIPNGDLAVSLGTRNFQISMRDIVYGIAAAIGAAENSEV